MIISLCARAKTKHCLTRARKSNNYLWAYKLVPATSSTKAYLVMGSQSSPSYDKGKTKKRCTPASRYFPPYDATRWTVPFICFKKHFILNATSGAAAGLRWVANNNNNNFLFYEQWAEQHRAECNKTSCVRDGTFSRSF